MTKERWGTDYEKVDGRFKLKPDLKQSRSVFEEILEEAKADLAAERANETPEQKAERERLEHEAEREDNSRERERERW
jgi:hypothetical protein